MSDTYQTFHIGVNSFVVKNEQLLLGKRKNVYGAGSWGLPGGHLEIGEALKDAVARELLEETGLSANDFEFSNIVNDRSGDQHYIQIGFVALNVSGKLELKEPDRCEEWSWFKFETLPQDLFPPHVKQIENFIKKIYFVDA